MEARGHMQEVALDDAEYDEDGRVHEAQDDVAFVDVDTDEGDAGELGELETKRASSQGGASPQGYGQATQYLNSRGFGWLMELDEDEDDEDSRRPLLEELDIDLPNIIYKIRCVLVPFGMDRSRLRNDPDFWGPLLVVILYAVFSLYGHLSVVSWIITIWMVGSILLFVLGRVLGGDTGFAQTLGVVGYSVLPLILTAALVTLLPLPETLHVMLKAAGVGWATFSAGSLLATGELEAKRILLLYPILLLYVYFSSLHSGA